MSNLNSVIKKKSGSKHSRKELISKSPIPWVVIIVATLITGAFLIFPNASDWMKKRAELKEMVSLIPELESTNQALTNDRDLLNTRFKDKAKPYIKIADQRFPVEINTTTITQVLEMYAILMRVNYRSNDFELKSLSVGQPQNVDGSPFAKSSVNINVLIDREMLEAFIGFLQTGEITNELENRVIASGGGETASIEFLKLNKLPVATINSLSLNEERSQNESSNKEVYNAQLQVLFYSEPV